MKKILILLCSLASAHASLSTINWTADSLDHFRVELTGIGMPIASDLTSPSGIWELFAREQAEYAPDQKPWWGQPDIGLGSIFINGGQSMFTWHGLGYDMTMGCMLYPSYQTPDPAFPGNHSNWTGGLLFWGNNPLAITSLPNLLDNSTWGWAATYEAFADLNYIETTFPRVPESGGILCLGIGLLGLLLFFRPRKETA